MVRILPVLLLLAACSDTREVPDELPNSSLAGAARQDVPETAMDTPVARPVTIGEDGARLDACGGLGQVTRAGSAGLALRAAPFADARVSARLGEGDRLHICTRSLDQKWLGVVVSPAVSTPAVPASATPATVPAPAGTPPVDCGVSSPVDRKQPYDGPCPSGWVSSAYVQLIAG